MDYSWILYSVIVLMICDSVTGQCSLNDCLCEDDLILCDEENQPDPLFTEYERAFARRLSLSLKQAVIIPQICRTLPNVRYLEITDNKELLSDDDSRHATPTCPTKPCRGVKVVCL